MSKLSLPDGILKVNKLIYKNNYKVEVMKQNLIESRKEKTDSVCLSENKQFIGKLISKVLGTKSQT